MSNQESYGLRLVNRRKGEAFALNRAPVTIGRQADNVVVLADSSVSRHHATVFRQDGTFFVQDLGSTNGTYIDDRKINGPQPLQPGLVLRFGDVALDVQRAPVAAPPPRPSSPKRSGLPIVAGLLFGLVLAGAIFGVILLFSGQQETEPGVPIVQTPTPDQVADAQETVIVATPTLVPEISPTALPPTAPPPDTPVPDTPTPPPDTPVPDTPTPSPSPTDTPVPAKPTPKPTSKPTNTPRISFPPAALLAPEETGTDSLQGQVTFQWSYPRPLNADEAFQVLIWKEGQPHNGAAELWTETQQTINLDVVLPQRGGSGEFFWTVVVRQKGTEKLISPEASPRRLNYQEPVDVCAACDCSRCDAWNAPDCCGQCCGN